MSRNAIHLLTTVCCCNVPNYINASVNYPIGLWPMGHILTTSEIQLACSSIFEGQCLAKTPIVLHMLSDGSSHCPYAYVMLSRPMDA